jgi:RHS repeat-associated protein
MNKSLYFGNKNTKRLAKLTAFCAAFLLLLEPFSVVFAQQELTSHSSPETSQTITPESVAVEGITINSQEIDPGDVNNLTETQDIGKQWKNELKKRDRKENLKLGSEGTSKTIQDPEIRKSLLKTDSSTGALTYTYPLILPIGRNNLTPNLALTYSSNAKNTNSFVGDGWTLSVPSVERINRKGSEKLYTEDYFNSSLSGELVNISGSTYGAKVESGDFLSYSRSGDSWVLKDKSGTTYSFGLTSASRQDDPNDSSRIYKWMLEEVRDANNNFIRYEYFKHNGQIYPSKILYTGFGSVDGIFTITFNLDNTFEMGPQVYTTGFAVKTNYRVSTIEIAESNNWIKKYVLGYDDDQSGKLLASIQESGRDLLTNTITTLEPTNLSYKKNEAPLGWTQTSDNQWELPIALYVDNGGGSTNIQIRDVNGDAYPDVLYSQKDGDICANRSTQINDTHGGWIGYSGCNVPWEIPHSLFLNNPENLFSDYGTRAFDYNGDYLPDLIWAFASDKGQNPTATEVYKNSGDAMGTWIEDSEFNPPTAIVYYDNVHADNAVQIVDVNGDGLQDLYRYFGDSFVDDYVYLNTGSGWVQASPGEWELPASVITQDGGPDDTFTHAQFVDLNNDGLVDIYWSDDGSPVIERAFINNGHTWLPDSIDNWTIPLPFWSREGAEIGNTDAGSRSVDVNGDGIIDIVSSHCWNSGCDEIVSSVWLNKNDEFSSGGSSFYFSETTIPEGFASNNYETLYSIIVDMNADGMDDITYALSGQNARTHLSKSTPHVNLLVSIETPAGGISSISYKSSTKYYDENGVLQNPKLPIVITTVDSIISDDSFGNQSVESYVYADGHYYFNDPYDRKFAGFGVVTETDAVGNITKTYYHQGNDSEIALGEYEDHIAKMGKPYRIETYDASGNLYQLTINKWDSYNIGTDHDFVKLARTTTLAYDGDTDHKDTAIEYIYDNANGNLLTEIIYGEVTASTDGSFTDTGSDKGTVTYLYATNGSGQFATSQQTLVNNAGNKVADTKYFYDGQPFGTLTLGNVTKTRNWKTGSQWVDTLTSYNAFGLPTTTTDPRGNATTYSYDAYNLYPVSVTNPLLQVTQYVYDYSSGKPIQITDANNLVTQTVLDGLDRVIEEKIPDPTVPTTLVTKTTYLYTDTSGAVSIQKTDHLDGSTSVDSYQYFDGLGRIIQERREAEASNTFNAKDFTYNSRGLLEKESLPYTSTGSARTVATTDTTLYSTSMYDPLSRPLTTSNILGTTAYAYDDWKTTITDANGKEKILTSDAYQNLVTVEEKNAGAIYTTTYKWNLAKRLTKLTDALGNIRNFTYDGLGRRLTAEDLHAPADTTFGTWTYSYDDAGNPTQSADPKAQTINYTYDSLNRTLTENYTGTTGTDITYTYDTGIYGKGHLASATVAGSVASVYTHNPNGAVASEAKTISSTTYTTSYTYDRQGNILTLTYPDLSQAKYLYSTAGYLNKIRRKENGGSFVDVVTSFNYAPTGEVKVTNFANGVSTINTYDATKLYRLTNKKATLGQIKYQNLSYTYDSVGNIMQIVDASNTNTAKTLTFTYDDLYRLLSATSTAAVAGGNFTETYSYDELGNILSKSDLGTYAYAGNTGTNYANPHAVTMIAGITRAYDPNGNLLTDGTNTYTWNYKNQLTNTTTAGGALSYVYDHSGSRQKYTTPTSTTITPNRYYEEEGAIKRCHIYGGDTLLATVEKDGATITPYYVHSDHLGSVEKMTSQAGLVTELNDFYPFGKVRYTEGGVGGDKTFLGKYHDTESGLEYLEARYYGSKLGQFTSQDPAFLDIGDRSFKAKYERILAVHLANPQALNSYSYAHNNPVTNKDPQGEIVPLLVAALAVVEVGLSLYDGYIAYQTTNDPDTNNLEKGVAVGGFVAGLIGPAGGYGAAGNKALQIYKEANPAGRALMKGVQNERVLNLIKDNYRAGAKIGSGSTADAIIHTARTGELVGNSTHVGKAESTLNRIANIFKKYGLELNSHETKALNKITNDLKSALKKTKK